jgi:hypothetical protein
MAMGDLSSTTIFGVTQLLKNEQRLARRLAEPARAKKLKLFEW